MLISKRISRATQHKIELHLFKALYGLCRAMPIRAVLKLGEWVGVLALSLGIRRQTVLTNLHIAFGERFGPRELRRIVADCYRHFGREVTRILVMDRQTRRPVEEWMDVEGLEALRERKAAGGVLVSGHFGVWEMVPLILPLLGIPLTVFTGRHSNKAADRFLNRIRGRTGTRTVGAADDPSDLVRAAGLGMVALAGDQLPGKASIAVSFFGRETAAAQGPALLALLNNVDLFYFSCVNVDGRLRARIQKVDFERAEKRKDNIHRLTAAYFKLLQADIERHPAQYFWMHRRWNNDPGVRYDDKEALF